MWYNIRLLLQASSGRQMLSLLLLLLCIWRALRNKSLTVLPFKCSSLIGNHFRLEFLSCLRVLLCVWRKKKKQVQLDEYKSLLLPRLLSNYNQTWALAVEDSYKMDKQPVTRTFSFGAICSGSKASDDLSTTRRHSGSSAGIRALLWATGSAKSFGCSTDSQTSRENIFANILTPDSIPQFTIPSLSVQTSFWSLDKEAQDNEAESEGELRSCGANASSSSSSSCSSLLLSGRKAERCLSDPLAKRRSFLQRDAPFPPSNKSTLYCLDPASKAALSLPHLTKVTTPYGFVTLSQSPQMASEEALLCQAGSHCLNSDSKASSAICASGSNAEVIKGNCSHLLGAKKKLSKDFPDSQSGESLLRGEPHASPSASSSSSSTPKPPDKLKRRFYHIIKKYLM